MSMRSGPRSGGRGPRDCIGPWTNSTCSVTSMSAPDGRVQCWLRLPIPGCPLKDKLTADVTAAAMGVDGVTGVSLEFTSMTRRGSCRRGAEGARRRHARGDNRQSRLQDPSHRDLVGQGRCRQVLGDGQSRRGARRAGSTVGIIDADVWGFSIPKMLGIDRPPDRDRRDAGPAGDARRSGHVDGLLRRRPTRPSSGAVRCCTRRWSSSSPTFTGAIRTILLIDMPPGTGDIAISISQFLPEARGHRGDHTADDGAAGRQTRPG